MSKLYSARHRELQDRFDTRRLADLLEEGIVHEQLSEAEQAFIASRDMFFLSTIDADGRPTVSYKGGDPGVVRVVHPGEIAFPCYDGNGMFYSMGNLATNGKVGLLFIDFETPHRLRVQGDARIDAESPLLAHYAQAQFMVHVALEAIWVNCPRYIHRHQRVATSPYVPRPGRETPVPAWKRIDFVQDALPARDQGKAEAAGGLIDQDQYEELVGKGEA